jgi:hypothetical protein
MEMGRY